MLFFLGILQFQVSCLSLMHSKLIFVSAIRQQSNFILLHIITQFSQPHLLKRPSFPILCFGAIVESQSTIYAWVYFWVLYSVPLIYVFIFMLVPDCLLTYIILYDSLKSQSVMLQLCSSYSRLLCLWSFVTPCKIQDCFFYFYKRSTGILIG